MRSRASLTMAGFACLAKSLVSQSRLSCGVAGSPFGTCRAAVFGPEPVSAEQVPHVPGMSPGTLLSILAPSPSPHEDWECSEPPENGTTSGAPLRRDIEITEASCPRNIKATLGKLPRGCFWQMLHKKHARPRLQAEDCA